jgi:tRNA G10  N-methylase Trm11
LNLDLFLEQIDSTKISSRIKPNLIDAIVTEPYLGPQRGSHNIEKTVQFLEDLYSKSIKEFSKILKKNGFVVMVWPVFVSREGDKRKYFLDNIDLDSFEIVPLLNNKYLENNNISLSRKGGIIYGRLGQKIWREIILLKLK